MSVYFSYQQLLSQSVRHIHRRFLGYTACLEYKADEKMVEFKLEKCQGQEVLTNVDKWRPLRRLALTCCTKPVPQLNQKGAAKNLDSAYVAASVTAHQQSPASVVSAYVWTERDMLPGWLRNAYMISSRNMMLVQFYNRVMKA
ncbi:hypothetical protein VNO80_22880 [Phaseolus coccineus]|uniref:Uncharacterized protein n=1 Tax=Phaseolus coccineus TaxID=3886 RepID=A0AAN9M5R4_PHACN